MSPLSHKKLFRGWIVASILLGILLLVALFTHRGLRFSVMLNGANLLALTAYLIFKKNLKNLFQSLKLDYENIKSSNHTIEAKYLQEPILSGLILLPPVLFGIYVVALAILDIDAYDHLIKEDGPVEYASALCWFGSALLLLIGSLRQIPRNKKFTLHLIPYICLTVFFILCGGEEISWGQRILGLETPALMTSLNLQHELNLHDIGSISVFSNAFFLLSLLFFLYIPLIVKKHLTLHRLMLHYYFPIPHRHAAKVYLICLAVWIAIGLRFGTLGFHPFSVYAEKYYTQLDDEIFELFAAYSFTAFSLMNSVRAIHLTIPEAVSLRSESVTSPVEVLAES